MLRKKSPIKSKKTKRSQENLNFINFDLVWVFVVGLVGVLVFWLLQDTVSLSPTRTLALIQQKVVHSLSTDVNEISTDTYVSSILQSTGQFDPGGTQSVYDNANVTVPTNIAQGNSQQVLGANANRTADGREKWVEVNLSRQRLYAHEGDQIVYNFLISSGKRWTPTVTGTYYVWIKLRYTNMVGGSKAAGDYYNLPNVPYVMYFYQGYGLHGTYWHNNFGHPMSHGCVNVKTSEMALLYDWAGPVMPSGASFVKSTPDNPGIRVTIHY